MLARFRPKQVPIRHLRYLQAPLRLAEAVVLRQAMEDLVHLMSQLRLDGLLLSLALTVSQAILNWSRPSRRDLLGYLVPQQEQLEVLQDWSMAIH